MHSMAGNEGAASDSFAIFREALKTSKRPVAEQKTVPRQTDSDLGVGRRPRTAPTSPGADHAARSMKPKTGYASRDKTGYAKSRAEGRDDTPAIH
jgi:hypothetical protein